MEKHSSETGFSVPQRLVCRWVSVLKTRWSPKQIGRETHWLGFSEPVGFDRRISTFDPQKVSELA